MTDLMYQDMGDDGLKRIFALAPEIQQWPAIEPDHVGQGAGGLGRSALSQSLATEQSQKIELALRSHLIQRIVVGEVDDLNDKTFAQAAKRSRKLGKCRLGERIEVFQCRRVEPREAASRLRRHDAA
jgi:hypothetical protein